MPGPIKRRIINMSRKVQGKRPIVGLSELGRRSAVKHGFRRTGHDMAGRSDLMKGRKK